MMRSFMLPASASRESMAEPTPEPAEVLALVGELSPGVL